VVVEDVFFGGRFEKFWSYGWFIEGRRNSLARDGGSMIVLARDGMDVSVAYFKRSS